MIDIQVAHLIRLLRDGGCRIGRSDIDAIKRTLEPRMREAWAFSHHSSMIVKFRLAPGQPFDLEIDWHPLRLADWYDSWKRRSRKNGLGSHPDARVVDLAGTLGEPVRAPILDLGAGTGRNTLALARGGHPVTAVEVTPSMAAAMSEAATRERLPVVVHQQDLFDERLDLPRNHYALVILSHVVPEFRGSLQLRTMIRRVASLMRPGGVLLFSSFLSAPDFKVTESQRQQCEARRSSVFTRKEIRAALSGRGLGLRREFHAHDYERDHLPPKAWPPTRWFASWSRGRDVFALPRRVASPIELFWIEAQKGA
jgi:SAM-dependent methyltransferase